MSNKKGLSVKDNPKKRLPNFSTDEKMTLTEIIESKKHIIESKQTDAVTIKEKEKCWLDISREFNSRCILANRNVASLKNCWDNLKKRTRRHFAEVRKEVFATGGGKMTIPDDPIAERVKSIIQPSVDGLKNPFDSDHVPGIDDVNVDQDTNDDGDDMVFDVEALDETDVATVWANWTPAMLKSNKSTELDVPICNDNEVAPDLDFPSDAEIEAAVGTSLKENRNATNPTSSIVKKKIVKRGKHTRMPVRPVISAVKRNQCFYDLAQSKAELVELMKKDLSGKSEIELQILNVQLEKEQLEVKILKKQLQSYEK
ncbi:uncharacterized protein LOC143895690 isoform X1 [Temnothorax americanus]|uniref:uncharacterized protein LOC143895690 isoform X1 n=1 Tax=Temnothorax americanus TaxID=1964332 RepID=UPI0040679F0A